MLDILYIDRNEFGYFFQLCYDFQAFFGEGGG
jgi:hypothetical protein